MLINLSNHPSSKWSHEQLSAAKFFGNIIDIPFPAVNPEGDDIYINKLACQYKKLIEGIKSNDKIVIHIMGELNFVFSFVTIMRTSGFTCVASTTERIVKELPDGQKITTFKFVKFRKYGEEYNFNN